MHFLSGVLQCLWYNQHTGIMEPGVWKNKTMDTYHKISKARLMIYSHYILKTWINRSGPCITNVFATRRKNFSQWHRSFQRKLLSHWLKFLRHVAITSVIPGPGLPISYKYGFYSDNSVQQDKGCYNASRPSDAYLRLRINHHWFR